MMFDIVFAHLVKLGVLEVTKSSLGTIRSLGFIKHKYAAISHREVPTLGYSDDGV